MPAISLRLTEGQLEELRAWAHDGHRSLQKEVIWRLFTIEGNQAPKVGPATNEPREGIKVPPDGTEAVLTEREEAGMPESGRAATVDDSRSVSPASGKERDVDADWLRRRAGGKK